MINKDNDIAEEWDSIADIRFEGRKKGEDKSYLYLLKPKFCERINALSKQCEMIIDVGCGTGELAIEMASYARKVIGLDISSRSIDLALKNSDGKVEFLNSSVQDYALKNNNLADICVLNMVLSNINNISEILLATNKILNQEGRLMVTIPHPCFWPEYWKYRDEKWFEYKKQICMQRDFKITGMGKIGKCTHVHRPIEEYINSYISTGFKIVYMEELFSEQVKGEGNFAFPRFIFFECVKEY